VFIILRDEKKSPDVNKKRQIPMSLQILKELKGKSSECDKNLMVSTINTERLRVIFTLECPRVRNDCANLRFHVKNIFMENHIQNGDIEEQKSFIRLQNIFHLVFLNIQLILNESINL
jgi:hypothetical protein